MNNYDTRNNTGWTKHADWLTQRYNYTTKNWDKDRYNIYFDGINTPGDNNAGYYTSSGSVWKINFFTIYKLFFFPLFRHFDIISNSYWDLSIRILSESTHRRGETDYFILIT